MPISTSVAQAGQGPTTVALPAGAGGLKKDSVAICHQVTTLDRATLVQRIGALDAPALLNVDNGLKTALQLSWP